MARIGGVWRLNDYPFSPPNGVSFNLSQSLSGGAVFTLGTGINKVTIDQIDWTAEDATRQFVDALYGTVLIEIDGNGEPDWSNLSTVDDNHDLMIGDGMSFYDVSDEFAEVLAFNATQIELAYGTATVTLYDQTGGKVLDTTTIFTPTTYMNVIPRTTRIQIDFYYPDVDGGITQQGTVFAPIPVDPPPDWMFGLATSPDGDVVYPMINDQIVNLTSNTALYAVFYTPAYVNIYNADGTTLLTTYAPGTDQWTDKITAIGQADGTILFSTNENDQERITLVAGANTRFSGFKTSALATTITYAPGTHYVPRDAALNLYAVWSIEPTTGNNKLQLFNNTAEPHRADKSGYLIDRVEVTGTMRAPCDIADPTVLVESTADVMLKKNYAYMQ